VTPDPRLNWLDHWSADVILLAVLVWILFQFGEYVWGYFLG
jgi:hypothetical protein